MCEQDDPLSHIHAGNEIQEVMLFNQCKPVFHSEIFVRWGKIDFIFAGVIVNNMLSKLALIKWEPSSKWGNPSGKVHGQMPHFATP